LFINRGEYPPTLTYNHIGFICKGRRLWASSADGTTHSETDTTVDVADDNYVSVVLKAVCDPGVDVKFYSNEALIATHTLAGHNIPLTTTAWGVVNLGIKTTNTTSKGLTVGRVLIFKEL